MLARSRLRAIAVDGKTSRGARRGDGTRVYLLSAAEHGGHLLDHLEVGAAVHGPRCAGGLSPISVKHRAAREDSPAAVAYPGVC